MKFVQVQIESESFFGNLEEERVVLWTRAPWDGGVATSRAVKLDDVRLLAPCKPRKVLGMAINFPGATGLAEGAQEPLVFFKNGNSIIGPKDTIISPFKNVRVWGECELGIVIGNLLTRCTIDEARAAVFGYVIGNDVTADNIQDWDHHLPRSKAADTFCSLGPWIDTDFDPNGKFIRGYQNNLLVREASANDRIWSEPNLLVWLSSWITLEPGDVILTGAPPRVRERIFMSNGDTYTCTVDGLGELNNSFRNLHD